MPEAGAGEAGEQEARRPEGAYLQGMGQYAVGAGVYNYDTALANQLNAQTFMQLNDYWAQTAHEAAFMHHARVHQEFLKDKTLYDAHIQALRDNPTPQQIANGDALNQAVRDLSDPRLSQSIVSHAANSPVEAKMIGEVPFENASERVTIMLDQLRAAFKWPEVFEEERFANDKKLFDDIVTRLRKEDQEGEISEKTLREARELVNDLDNKLRAQPLKDEDDQRQAKKFINACNAPHRPAQQARHPRRAGRAQEGAEGHDARQPAGLHARVQSALRAGDHAQAAADL